MDDWTYYALPYAIIGCLLAAHGLLLSVVLARRVDKVNSRIDDAIEGLMQHANNRHDLIIGEVGARAVEVRTDLRALDTKLAPVIGYVDGLSKKQSRTAGTRPATSKPKPALDMAAPATAEAVEAAKATAKPEASDVVTSRIAKAAARRTGPAKS